MKNNFKILNKTYAFKFALKLNIKIKQLIMNCSF